MTAACIFGVPLRSLAQDQSIAKITVISVQPGRVRIELRNNTARRSWSFLNTYGSAIGLGERIENVVGFKANGESVEVQKVVAGEFRSAVDVKGISYEVRLRFPDRTSDASHISWLTQQQGVLMLADLFPQTVSGAVIQLQIPQGWSTWSNLKNVNGVYSTEKINDAVFSIGTLVRQSKTRVQSHDVRVGMSGIWLFSPDDLTSIAGKLIRYYTQFTGRALTEDSVVTLVQLPSQEPATSWSAETRGNNVVIAIGPNSSRSELLARIRLILAHEIFHLWVPNSISLKGDYDWFYEGFTLYVALKTSLEMGLIDFPEFLATLGRVYDSYLSDPDPDRLSLIELSERRWTSGTSLIYNKAMIVAFLYDLMLHDRNYGQSHFTNLYRDVFRLDLTEQGEANEVIIALVDRPVGMEQFAAQYIQKPVAIDLKSQLNPFGITVERKDFRAHLTVNKNITNGQRKILRSIGYNK